MHVYEGGDILNKSKTYIGTVKGKSGSVIVAPPVLVMFPNKCVTNLWKKHIHHNFISWVEELKWFWKKYLPIWICLFIANSVELSPKTSPLPISSLLLCHQCPTVQKLDFVYFALRDIGKIMRLSMATFRGFQLFIMSYQKIQQTDIRFLF